MKTNIKVNHLAACRKVMMDFSKEKSVRIKPSRVIRIGTADYKKAGDLKEKPVLYVSYNKEGKALDVNYCCRWNWSNMNYFRMIDGCFEAKKEKWVVIPPPFCVEFYELEADGEDRDHGSMKELLKELKKKCQLAIKEEPGQRQYTSVAALFRGVSTGDLYHHYPWLEHSPHALVLESWKRVVEKLPMTTVGETDGYCVDITSLEVEGHAVGLYAAIRHGQDPEVSLSLEHCKDLSFISRLPVRMDARLDPISVVLNMLIRLSDTKIEEDEE